jgi:hypothetical protein
MQVPVDISLVVCTLRGEKMALAIARDIAERKKRSRR